MGLFDGKVKELGDTLATAFENRATQILKELEETKDDPGKSLLLKTTYASLKEVSLVIKNALNSD